MPRLFPKLRKQPGLAPGTMKFIGKQKMESMRLRVIDYSAEDLRELKPAGVEELFPHRDSPSTTWINVDGLHESEALAELGRHFGLHMLVMEDVLHTHQRPKFEDYPDHIFVVLQMLYMDRDALGIHAEQVSLVFGRDWVITFQESQGDIFEGVRQRLRAGRGRIRGAGAEYLAYTLADALVDHYFIILEGLGEEIEELEEGMLADPQSRHLERIHRLKRELVLLRRAVWPLREVIGSWIRSETPLVSDDTRVFLRDVHDHTVQVAEVLESYRDVLGGLQDLYLSSISNRMNEVMKVLTLIATVFIPLSFLAGIFGMNFDHMPELHWRFGYPTFWILVLLIGGGMFAWFKRKRWL